MQAAAYWKTIDGCVCVPGSNGAHAAGGAQTHVDQTVLTIVAADTVHGLQVRMDSTAAGDQSLHQWHVSFGLLLSEGVEHLAIDANSMPPRV